MSRKKKKRAADAVPDEILAEGSAPVAVAPEAVVEAAPPDDVEVDGVEATADALAEAARDVEARMAEEGEQPESGDDDETSALEEREAGEMAAEGEAGEAGEMAAAEGEAGELAAAPDAAVDGEAAEAAEAAEAVEAVGDEVSAVMPASASEIDDATLVQLVEALIFASDKPLTVQRLRQLTRIADVRRIESAIEQIAADHADRGIALQHVSGGYQFRTNTAYSAWVQQLVAGRPVRLSRAQLETLAIVAYRQPITRPEIDEIRGVDSSATLRLLLDRALVRVLGKREEVGRPMLYGTTGEFLDFFSLQDLRELPTLREYSELTAESRQVMSDRLGVGLEPEPERAEPEMVARGAEGGHAEPSATSEMDPAAVEPEPEHMSAEPEHMSAEPEHEHMSTEPELDHLAAEPELEPDDAIAEPISEPE